MDTQGWTILTLKTHLESLTEERRAAYHERIHDLEKALHRHIEYTRQSLADAIEASKAAVSKAEAATEKRFDSVNEFRSSLNDILNKAMPRSEAETANRSVQERVDASIHAVASRSDAAIDGLEKRVQDLSTRIERSEGRSSGISATGSAILAVLAIIVSLGLGVVNLIHGDPQITLPVEKGLIR